MAVDGDDDDSFAIWDNRQGWVEQQSEFWRTPYAGDNGPHHYSENGYSWKIFDTSGAGLALGADFYRRSSDRVARDLLGCLLERRLESEILQARIVETEAYLGRPDRASHAWGGRRSPRIASLYLVGGHAYVYFVYGMHHCVNVVAGRRDNPVAVLVRALEPKSDQEIRAAAEGLRYRDFLLVALIIDSPDLFPDNWIYVHTPGMKVGRIQNFRNWSEALVPDPEQSCVGMEYFCFQGDGLWESADADLIRLATEELGALGLADPALVVDGTVVRMPKAYPIYDFAYRDHVARIRSHIDPIGNLHTVGRNGMHKYNNQDHSMLTAMMTVWNMEGADHDIWAVNTDFEYLEEHRLAEERDEPDSSTALAAAGSG